MFAITHYPNKRDSNSREAAEEMDKKPEETEEEDDKDSDTYLHRLESILKRVHGAYFASYDALRLVAL